MPANKLKEADVTVLPPDVRMPFRVKLPELILFEPKFPNAGDEPTSNPTMNRPTKLRRFTWSSLPESEP